MRIIKFRAKDVVGKWVYGSLDINYHDRICDSVLSATIEGCDIYKVGSQCYEFADVNYDTIGQLSGLFDKNGKAIYDGDILRISEFTNVVCEFRHGAFGYIYCNEFHPFAGNTNYTFNPKNTDKEFEVVGNIHDNPELLKGGGE